MHWLLPFMFLQLHPVRPATWCADVSPSRLATSHLESLMDADGAEGDLSRRLFSLPRVPRDSLVLVTDERICQRASTAYYRYRLGPTPPGGIVVVRVRNRYVVYGAKRAGEWTITTVYSLEFETIVSILM